MGKQNPNKFDPVRESERLRQRGIKIIAIGITKEVDEKQLEEFTQDKEQVFFAENFDALESSAFVDKLTGKMCTVAASPSMYLIYFLLKLTNDELIPNNFTITSGGDTIGVLRQVVWCGECGVRLV